MIKFVADDDDLQMISGHKFWITVQRGYVVLNFRAVCKRSMCHHLILCKVWDKDELKNLISQLSDLYATL